MKKIALLAVITLISTGLYAQSPIRFGVKAGITTQSVDLKKNEAGSYSLSTSDRTGFHAGLMSRINLGIVHLQPEVIYSHTSYKLMADNSATKVKINTLEVPVLLGMNFLFFRFQAGPSFNLLTDTNVSGGVVSSVTTTKPSVSYLLGVGAELFGLNLDVRYNGQFKKVEQNFHLREESSAEIKSQFKAWTFSLGYMF